MSSEDSSSAVVRTSYFGGFFSLVGYGISALFGRAYRGVFGFFGSIFGLSENFSAQVTKKRNEPIKAKILINEEVDGLEEIVSSIGNTEIHYNRVETNCDTKINVNTNIDPDKAMKGEHFNLKLKAEGKADGGTFTLNNNKNNNKDSN